MKLYLQNIVKDNKDNNFQNLPIKWQGFDFGRFSKDKTLFDFQKQALQNALKGLWLYFKGNNPSSDYPFEKGGQEKPDDVIANTHLRKRNLFNHYKANDLSENFDYDLKKREGKKTAKYLLEYDRDYPALENKISFEHFINRMSFWMATGSGKTLIIVKLIEFLGKLITDKELPAGDLLYLAHRDDLLDQFKNHIAEFNSFNFDTKITPINLRDYESTKRDNALPFSKNEITVFYYRSDLISDIQKEKIINFRNFDNNGRWYILLDEAHKGDKEDSKRQILYSILSRNGFLFNFSATFTDPRDFATCVYAFNLSSFVTEGYGKHIYLSSTEISAFRDKTDFSPVEKQKVVLKTLVLLTYINKYFEEIRQVDSSLYHRPLLLTLVNSVDVEESDLELFFRELEKVAKNEIRYDLLDQAKQELIQDFNTNSKFEFEELDCVIDNDLISQLNYDDILKYVLNAETAGNIEVLKIPSNKNELIFKLKTAEKPFALIKIGDISGWLKDKLEGYEINESFENESYFRKINQDDSDINILMGSRAFYEGWDSNRPNIVLFVNIGIGSDAKKFVLQSVGRGVRIEPIKYQRKRLQNLLNAGVINEQLFQKINKWVLPIESLFIFGTNANNLKEIMAVLKGEEESKNLGSKFIINPASTGKILLIPVYRDSEKIFAEESQPQKISVSENDLALTKQLHQLLPDKVIVAKYDCDIKVLKKIRESFDHAEQYFEPENKNSLYEPEIILGQIINHFSIKNKKFDTFKELGNEIVHFKKIRCRLNADYEKIVESIQKVQNYPDKAMYIEQLKLDFDVHKDTNRFVREIEEAQSKYACEIEYSYGNEKTKIKYIANHYYLPVILSETEKCAYLEHIINVKSEVKFIEKMEEYLRQPDNKFKEFDWWLFSKLDQTVDEVSIPYYNPKEDRISDFKPDFIFWAQKGKKYLILFVDPKGTEHTDGLRKIDGFSSIFEDPLTKSPINFPHNGLIINVKLLLMPASGGVASVPEPQRKYWFDNFNDFGNKITLN
ncbi:MAG TPA: DEAD/DEAH box helicase family protein [Candidatus Marinimicrobia bacterium]|nr:DEAD/DEAH box helicase family protein [Candidatus Neomarinimicrobiota bacterium]HRS51980.1 DEAD/DEAH box helicase family protein [Candidatus Neomarinimicrobiota bacterium]HRU91891.1 DEAD/DEAH box helicase family protein [Candidatus Neomarinimicrobiota bacterium]